MAPPVRPGDAARHGNGAPEGWADERDQGEGVDHVADCEATLDAVVPDDVLAAAQETKLGGERCVHRPVNQPLLCHRVLHLRARVGRCVVQRGVTLSVAVRAANLVLCHGVALAVVNVAKAVAVTALAPADLVAATAFGHLRQKVLRPRRGEVEVAEAPIEPGEAHAEHQGHCLPCKGPLPAAAGLHELLSDQVADVLSQGHHGVQHGVPDVPGVFAEARKPLLQVGQEGSLKEANKKAHKVDVGYRDVGPQHHQDYEDVDDHAYGADLGDTPCPAGPGRQGQAHANTQRDEGPQSQVHGFRISWQGHGDADVRAVPELHRQEGRQEEHVDAQGPLPTRTSAALFMHSGHCCCWRCAAWALRWARSGVAHASAAASSARLPEVRSGRKA
mmetsp:Transcript_63178/g.197811  ORF Transcript_63178/g.197811 Transcript_63178/m.197811 type:complete len:389 (+) Transcript_63178:584-1750(+)